MSNAAREDSESGKCKVIPILFYQSTAPRSLYCIDCGYLFDELLPVTMPLSRVKCRGCGKRGFLLPALRK